MDTYMTRISEQNVRERRLRQERRASWKTLDFLARKFPKSFVGTVEEERSELLAGPR